ncbi:hypothetical protein D3C78_1584710 [compost metagenome]
MMDTHPFHEINREITMLANHDFQIFLFNNSDLTVLNNLSRKAVLGAEERVSLTYHITASVHIKNKLFAFICGFG